MPPNVGKQTESVKNPIFAEPSSWPYRPLWIQKNNIASSDSNLICPGYGSGPLPIGEPFHFESDLFVGIALMRMRGVRADDDEHYFRGRQRRSTTIIQGRFKEAFRADEVLTGKEFSRPFQSRIPRWIINAALLLIRRLSPGVQIDLDSDRPSMFSILAGTAEVIRADEAGTEPDITGKSVLEHCEIEGKNLTSVERKKLLCDPGAAANYVFDTESVYTFDFYQHIFDPLSYTIDTGIKKVDLISSLDNQAVQACAKTKDGRYLWSFDFWHEKCIEKS
mmetsp:Transcript_8848/g.19497  ORF Transcript_8848/g.19497 Transcript_8848/m.19497 type:complete len:278 (-) Transcript_8848:69-902(-)